MESHSSHLSVPKVSQQLRNKGVPSLHKEQGTYLLHRYIVYLYVIIQGYEYPIPYSSIIMIGLNLLSTYDTPFGMCSIAPGLKIFNESPLAIV